MGAQPCSDAPMLMLHQVTAHIRCKTQKRIAQQCCCYVSSMTYVQPGLLTWTMLLCCNPLI